MDFLSWVSEVLESCFIQDKEWNIRRIVVTLVVVIVLILLGYLFYR